MIKKVFISYAHQSQKLSDNVLELSDYLRKKGIDSEIDQYEEAPPEGWPKWMMRQIQEADFVLVVCSELFYKRANDCSGDSDGLGVKWETSLILQQLYSMNTNNKKFIPVIFEQSESKYIPLPLEPYTYYSLSDPSKKTLLTNRLRGISLSKRPPLGEAPEVETDYHSLEPKERKSFFFSSIIDTDLWDKAKWSGMLFFSDPSLNTPPLVCFMFKNEEIGERIFSELKKQFGSIDSEEEIRLSFIRGISCNSPQNYKVHMGSSWSAIDKKAKNIGLEPSKTLFMGLSRTHTMTPPAKSKNLDVFENSYKYFKEYGLTNVKIKNGSLTPDFDNIIRKKTVFFRSKDEILKNQNDEDSPAFTKKIN
jgi:SEFIR domain